MTISDSLVIKLFLNEVLTKPGISKPINLKYLKFITIDNN